MPLPAPAARGTVYFVYGGKLLKTGFASDLAFAGKAVSPASAVHANEAAHWDTLHAKYATKHIYHQEANSLDDACTNQAEPFLARLRRMGLG